MAPTTTTLTPPPLLTRLATLLPHGSGVQGEADLLTQLARKDPTLFQEARAELPALKALPPDLDSYEKLKARYEANVAAPPITSGIFGPEVKAEIKNNFENVAWLAPITSTISGTLGFAGGWGAGALIGGALGAILSQPLAQPFGDAFSCFFVPATAFVATYFGFNWLDYGDKAGQNDPHLVAAFKYVAPFTALGAGAVFLATRLGLGFDTVYNDFVNGDANNHVLWATLLLGALATVAGSVVGSVAGPTLSRATANAKASYVHWSETRTLKKALRAFETIGLSPDYLTGKLSEDTQRLATFADGPLKAYLEDEKRKLSDERGVLQAELERVRAGKTRPVLSKESTPEEQRDHLLAKLDRAEKRLKDAIDKLDEDGIAVFQRILDNIPALLADILEWDSDQIDVSELAALEALAEAGEGKADEAEIMLRLSRERLGALAKRFHGMIEDIRASRKATIEVERLSGSLRERPTITHREGHSTTDDAQRRARAATAVRA